MNVACNGNNGTPGWYLVCEYSPPGNVIGAFSANVQNQINTLPSPTVEASPTSTSIVGGDGSQPITTSSAAGAEMTAMPFVELRILAVVSVGGAIAAAML